MSEVGAPNSPEFWLVILSAYLERLRVFKRPCFQTFVEDGSNFCPRIEVGGGPWPVEGRYFKDTLGQPKWPIPPPALLGCERETP